ncbi:MAG TPA: PQQ-binding-like beta-propeller repeat protein [Thermoanaerobaculia bacterium]|nr:PQQ-binding-like beta-propeller repeat protein [Thermoanaerobaculia bacterium]
MRIDSRLLVAAAAGLATITVSLLVSAATAPDSNAPGAASPVNWPQFRGPGALPVSGNAALPMSWSQTENVEWVAEIPGVGWSSPIVWGGKVFLTTAVASGEMKEPSLGTDFSNEYVAELQRAGVSPEELEKRIYERDMEMPDEVTLSYRLLCLDLESGEVAWDRELNAGRPPVGRHRKNSFTSETPVTDGEAIYVYVAHLGLWAYDLDGRKLWHTPLERHQVYLDFGGGTSPALWKDRLFILNDNEESSFVAAFDARSGKQIWRRERTGMGVDGRRSGWSTPFVWNNLLRTELVTVGPGWAISYDLDGNELWRLPMASAITIASPFAWEGTLYLSAGAGGGPTRPAAAVRPGGSGEIALPHDRHPATGQPAPETSTDVVLWYDATAGGSYLPTPLVYQDRLYVLNEKGILSVYGAKTGREIYRSRIHREARNFTASPWAYGDAVFMINEEGTTFVVAAGDELEVLGINRLDEFVEATPALAGDRLLIRTKSRLYSIRQAPPAPASPSGR